MFLKSASFVSFTDKNFKCLAEIKIMSVRMSDTKIQDILHRTRTCLTENYSVWHDVSFCQTECLTSLKYFQEVCDLHQITSGFHRAFATGVACQQGTVTHPDTWFYPHFYDLLMLEYAVSQLWIVRSGLHLVTYLDVGNFCNKSTETTLHEMCVQLFPRFSDSRKPRQSVLLI